MKSVNNCIKCDEFDKETADIMAKMFSQDEQALMTMMLANSIHGRTMTLAKFHNSKTPENVQKQLLIKRDIDFSGAILGKFIVSLNPEYKETVESALKKAGIGIKVQHAPCPHQESDDGKVTQMPRP